MNCPDMKYLAIVLTAVLFLSCGNVNKWEFPSPDIEMEREVERTESAVDTAMSETMPQEKKVKEKPAVVAPETKKGSSSSSSAKRKSYSSTKSSRSSSSMRHSDNMRGFDPASEDDMDDNGMSRYMENNDDEGWD